jgi:hypothetical protein
MRAGVEADRPLHAPAVDADAAGDAGRALEVEHARRRRRQVAAHVHRRGRAGREFLRARPAVVRRRQVEEPRRKVCVVVIRARHDRRARRLERSPVGAQVPRVRHAAGVLRKRPRRRELHAPPVLDEQQARRDAPRDQRDDARACARRGEEPRVEPVQRRYDTADEQRLGDAIERDAVERAADMVGPQKCGRGCKPPQQRHHCRTARAIEVWQCPASPTAAPR